MYYFTGGTGQRELHTMFPRAISMPSSPPHLMAILGEFQFQMQMRNCTPQHVMPWSW